MYVVSYALINEYWTMTMEYNIGHTLVSTGECLMSDGHSLMSIGYYLSNVWTLSVVDIV